jgi:hypothetical protein
MITLQAGLATALCRVDTLTRRISNVSTLEGLETPQNPLIMLVRIVTPRAGRAAEAALVTSRRHSDGA